MHEIVLLSNFLLQKNLHALSQKVTPVFSGSTEVSTLYLHFSKSPEFLLTIIHPFSKVYSFYRQYFVLVEFITFMMEKSIALKNVVIITFTV